MTTTTARTLADRILAGRIRPTGGYGSTSTLWEAYDALDAVILTADEERDDFARKDAVFGLLRKIAG